MMQQRIEKCQEAMSAQGLDAVFINSLANVRYLSGFTGSESYVLLTCEASYFITDSRFIEQAGKQCAGYKCLLHKHANPPLEQVVLNTCRATGVRRLGFESDYLTFSACRRLADVLASEVELVPSSGIVERLRYVKDNQEISCLREACAATDRVFANICDYIRPGVTEKDVQREIIYMMQKEGCENGFEMIVAAGINGSLPHTTPSPVKQIETGEMVTLDFGCMLNGYHADITRTVMVGQPAAWQEELYAIVLEANCRGEAAVRPGVLGKEVDAAARGYIAEKGYGGCFGHNVGHGVGLEIHEDPPIGINGGIPLEKGCVITVEPGIYLPGQGGLRIEDTVLVTENGGESLFRSPKEMMIL